MRLIEFKNKEDANIANWTYHENVHEQSLKIWFSHIIDSVQGIDHLWQHLYKLIFQVNWKLILKINPFPFPGQSEKQTNVVSICSVHILPVKDKFKVYESRYYNLLGKKCHN